MHRLCWRFEIGLALLAGVVAITLHFPEAADFARLATHAKAHLC